MAQELHDDVKIAVVMKELIRLYYARIAHGLEDLQLVFEAFLGHFT